MTWFERVLPVADTVRLDTLALVLIVAAVLVTVGVGSIWRWVRLGVTLVHELGHALVGMAFGRQFTGFVLRGDMSGHAVTRGPVRGLGRIASTWAGYPAPAILGAFMVWAATRGWAAPVVTGLLVVLVVALFRVRSLLTAVVALACLAGAGALWWWRVDGVQLDVVTGVGIFLVVGALRHLGALRGDRSTTSDPGVLATLTHVPRLLWTATFYLVCLGCAALVVGTLAPLV